MEHLEIEFKILIDKDTYLKIISDYNSNKSYKQTNYYLFHPKLKEKKYALRIREKDNNYELTLKIPDELGLKEINLIIDNDIKDKIFNKEDIDNEIFNILKKDKIYLKDMNLDYSLTTIRHDIYLDEGVLSLDENYYLDCIDYELEFEVNDYNLGLNRFYELIKPYNLDYKVNCKSKIKRLLDKINNQS